VWQRTVGIRALSEIEVIRTTTKENPMNTFSASPTMTLSVARYVTTVPAEQTQARATLRAIKAEQRSARASRRSPWASLVRRFAVSAPTTSPASRPLTAR
jgi:hypothetical protein